MTKIIFLDIDGVMNCRSDWKSPHQGTYVIDPKKKDLLVSFIKKHDFKVVLSSTWRNHSDHVDYLYEQGVLHPDWVHEDWRTIQGESKHSFSGTGETLYKHVLRGDEIQEWLDRHSEVTFYLILDDGTDFLKHQKRFFVRTSFEPQGGLTHRHIRVMEEILHRKG
jgi:hypothetical protein